MAESTAPDGADRFGQWLGYWFSRPVGKLALTALLGLLLTGCAWLDERNRARGTRSLFAPSREDFSFSLQLGAAVGLVAILADFLHSLARQLTRRPRAARANEAPGRKRSGVTVGTVWATCWGVLCLVPPFALGLWFTWQGCFPVVPVAAPLAVLVPGMVLHELIFGAKPPEARPQAAPVGN
jgi:hypothetical protein